MKINRIGNWVKSNVRGRQQYYLDLRNPSLQAVGLNGRIAPYGGGKPITPKEAAALFEKAGLHDLAKAVSPETPVEELLELAEQNDVDYTIEMEIVKNLKNRQLNGSELTLLAQASRVEVREIVAKSSATPNKVLLELVKHEYKHVPLLTIENLRKKGVEETEIMTAAAKSPSCEARAIAAKSPATPNEVLFELIKDENAYNIVGVAIENLGSRKIEETEIMTAAAKNPSCEARAIAAKSPAIPNEVLFELIKDKSEYVTCLAVENLINRGMENAELMTVAAKHPWDKITKKVLESPATSNEVLFELVKDKSEYVVRTAIKYLRNRGVKEEEIMKVAAKSPSCKTRKIAAESSVTPTDMLWVLVGDGGGFVVSAAITNLRSRGVKEVMKVAAKNPSWKAREKVAESSAASIKILIDLVGDKNEDVASAAIKNLRNRKFKEAELIQLAKIRWGEIREIAARSPATPIKVLLELVGDKDRGVVSVAIKNLKSREEFKVTELIQLAKSPSGKVREIAAKSPATPIEILIELVGEIFEDVASAAIKNLRSRGVKEEEIMEVAAKSLSEKVRYIAAKSSVTPNEVLVKLVGDGDYLVARTAKETLSKLIEG